MVSVFTRVLGRNYSPVIQTCLSLYLACDLVQASLPHMAAVSFLWFCWLPVSDFPIAFCPLSPATQVSGCFAALQYLPGSFRVSFLSLFYPVIRVFSMIKYITFQPEVERPYEPNEWSISGTNLVFMIKDVQCSSWGW